MNQKAKILEISSYPPPYAGWGVRVQFVRRRLKELGHDCQVLNIGKSRKLKSSEYIGITSGMDYVLKLLRFCRQGYLVHMHMNGQSNKGIVLAFLAEGISLFFGRRCVLTFHAGADQRFFPKGKSKWMRPVLYIIFSIPKRIICNDQIVKRKISEYGISPSKIKAIPAFSKQYLDFKPAELPGPLIRFMKSSRPLLACYLLLRPTFDIETLLRAIQNLGDHFPDLGLVLMGSNTIAEDLDPFEISRLVDELDIGTRLFWAGDLPRDQFLTILSRASVFVRTYVYDGVCSSVLEALALKVPVVACENPHRPPGVVIFKTGDINSLVKGIKQVLEDKGDDISGVVGSEVRDTVAEEALMLERMALNGESDPQE